MRKLFQGLLILCFLVCPTISAHAGFDWGKGTYEAYDDILIINSLGDQVAPSTFGNLGVNDFIPENGVKNYLALEGYTKAVDYNPSVTNPQFASFYNQAPGEGYTKLTFAGLYGDPRQTQDVYVLTSEYNAFSAKSQDIRINNETDSRIAADSNLQSNINTVDSQSIARDNELKSDISNESVARQSADQKLQDKNNEQDKRLDKLEQTQYKVVGEVRIHDSKKWQVNVYSELNTTRAMVDEVGVKFTFKMGESYEEKRINELEAKLNKLLEVENVKVQESVQVVPNGPNGLKVVHSF